MLNRIGLFLSLSEPIFAGFLDLQDLPYQGYLEEINAYNLDGIQMLQPLILKIL